MEQIIHNKTIKISQLPLSLVVVNSDCEIIEISNSAIRLFEIETDIPFNIKDIVSELPEIPITQFVSNKELERVVSWTTKKGEIRWIKIKSYPSFDDTNELYFLLFEDFTSQKMEFNLNDQAQKIARVGSWTVDLINNTNQWSNMTKEIHEVGLDYQPQVEKGIDFYKKGEHRDKIIEVVSECIESGKPFDEELIIVTAKGNERWVRAIGQPERVNGKTIGFYGVFQDIDDIKQQEIEYQKLEQRKKVAIESANIGIWDYDIVNNDLIWNSKMYEIFDVDSNKFDGCYEAWAATVHPDDIEKSNHEVELAIKGEKEFNADFRIIKQDGSIAIIHGEGKVFRDAKGNPLRMVGINTDVTSKRRKDERLRKLLRTTEEQNKKLINFAYIVSHNIRSHSSNISMISGMLLSNVAKEENDKFLGMIQKSSEELEDTLNNLNEILKIQTENDSDLEQVKVLPILEKSVQENNNEILSVNAIVSLNIDKNFEVLANKRYLFDICSNLISNSLKYRNVEKTLEIKITAQEANAEKILRFSDNGLGIDLKKYGKHIFGMNKTFHQHENSKGVGLFINRTQMEAMNGKIEVESEIMEGTTFCLKFNN